MNKTAFKHEFKIAVAMALDNEIFEDILLECLEDIEFIGGEEEIEKERLRLTAKVFDFVNKL